MYCTSCGSKIEDDARFCTACGCKVESSPEAVLNDKLVEEAEDARSDDAPTAVDLKSTVGSAKRRSISAVRMIALVALAVALAAGAAYAAYRIYADVWLPSQQAQQQMQEAEAPEQYAKEEESSKVADGHPENVFQLAEVLEMDPADMPAYFESQGFRLERYREWDVIDSMSDSQMPSLGKQTDTWQPSGNVSSLFAQLNQNGALVATEVLDGMGTQQSASRSGGKSSNLPTLVVGGEGLIPYFPSYALDDLLSESDLESDTGVKGVALTGIPLVSRSDDTVTQLCEAMGLGSPSAKVEHGDGGTRYNYRPDITVCSGSVPGSDGLILWYAVAYDVYDTGQSTVSLGCLRASDAYGATSLANLYTEEEWGAADDAVKAKYLANSVLQSIQTPGDGGMRENIFTSEVEHASYNKQTTRWDWTSGPAKAQGQK